MRPPRKLYYGWKIVLALSFTEMASYGILYYAFTVFLQPMEQTLGWSRGEMTGAFSLALAVGGGIGLLFGPLLDRHGARWLMTAGSILAVLLLLAWSTVETLPAFYLIWAGMGVATAAVLYEPAFAVVARWFVRKRGTALTVLTFIAGFASVVYIPLAEWLVRMQGWRPALVTLALILAAITIPLHALVLRRRPQDMGLTEDGEPTLPAAQMVAARSDIGVREALRHSLFWWLTAAFAFTMLASIAINVHFVPYLIDQGYDSAFAASAAGLIGILSLPGRLVFTRLGDRLPRGWVTVFLFALQALAFIVLLLIPDMTGVIGFVILFGAAFGAVTPARAALVADYYGALHYGRISSVLFVFLTVARAAAPVGVGTLRDSIGSYEPIMWGLFGLSAVAAVFVAIAADRAARRTHLAEPV